MLLSLSHKNRELACGRRFAGSGDLSLENLVQPAHQHEHTKRDKVS